MLKAAPLVHVKVQKDYSFMAPEVYNGHYSNESEVYTLAKIGFKILEPDYFLEIES